MKSIFMVVLLLGLVSACGDGVNEAPPYTWGDAAAQISNDYCQAKVNCGLIPIDFDFCYKHTYSHLCELDNTCLVELPDDAKCESDNTCFAEPSDEAVDDVILCSDSLINHDENNCFVLTYFGSTPLECNAFWEWQPLAEE